MNFVRNFMFKLKKSFATISDSLYLVKISIQNNYNLIHSEIVQLQTVKNEANNFKAERTVNTVENIV